MIIVTEEFSMAWYNEAVFYHIYPLGMTGAPKENDYGEPVERLNKLIPWISHIKNIGCNALYIGPLFESVGHGYETTDYKKLDSRLGNNDNLKDFVNECHNRGIRVILDGVFNHTGRDFFAFKDIKENRENSQYKDWYCNVNFGGNNEYNDGFSYENWGGYNLLVKLNQRNPAVKDYICDVIRFWVSEFDIDGIRLDAADVLDFDFMKELRKTANEVKEDFWLMGEVIHGDYSSWANDYTLHSVTNYHLHKALYSGHNDHNYYEIAHTVKRLNDLAGGKLCLYNFVDNHDVERIYTKLTNKAQFTPVHILMYTLPGVPSIYYGSEFGIEGKKEKWSDDSLRPEIDCQAFIEAAKTNEYVKLISVLGKVRQQEEALNYGDFRELMLTNRQYAFSRNYKDTSVIVMVNNDEKACWINVAAANGEYKGVISGNKISVTNGNIPVEIGANSGEIWVPVKGNETIEVKAEEKVEEKIEAKIEEKIEVKTEAEPEVKEEAATVEISPVSVESDEEVDVENTLDIDDVSSYENLTVEQLQNVILEKMRRNGSVTEQMKKDVMDNIYHNSLVTWAKSF